MADNLPTVAPTTDLTDNQPDRETTDEENITKRRKTAQDSPTTSEASDDDAMDAELHPELPRAQRHPSTITHPDRTARSNSPTRNAC